VNIGIVMVFAAFYLRFLKKHPQVDDLIQFVAIVRGRLGPPTV
jgi:hypothetical protein